MSQITLIKSMQPSRICKRFTIKDGRLQKDAIANVTEAQAASVNVSDVHKMVRQLERVTESHDQAICTGIFHNAPKGKFNLLSENKLKRIVNCDPSNGVIEHKGEWYAARKKVSMAPTPWLLIDADNPTGIPPEYARMNINERLELLEPIVPNISKCERIELRSSSSRVVKDGEKPPHATHAWIKVNDADKLEVLRAHIDVEADLHGISFKSPRLSSIDGKEIGQNRRTIIDLAVFIHGRLVFCAKPIVEADGYSVVDADIRIVNEGMHYA